MKYIILKVISTKGLTKLIEFDQAASFIKESR
jgi:hypothetical protein